MRIKSAVINDILILPIVFLLPPSSYSACYQAYYWLKMRHSFTLLLLGATLAFAGHSVNGDVPELTKVKDEWRSDLQKRFRRTQSVNGVQPATVETEAKLYRSAKVENVKKKMTVMSSTDVRMKGKRQPGFPSTTQV